MPQEPKDDKINMVQVMAWFLQAKSYYLNNVDLMTHNKLIHQQLTMPAGALLLRWINLIPAWISNHMLSKEWDEIIHSQTSLIGSDNGLPPIRYQVIIWTSDDMLSITP